jgi:hypothetical protein
MPDDMQERIIREVILISTWEVWPDYKIQVCKVWRRVGYVYAFYKMIPKCLY